MALRWTASANRDLVRLHGFLESVDHRAAVRAVRRILAGVRQLGRHPRLGARVPGFEPREVRRLIAGDHELRYELRDGDLSILRIWHVHEDR